MKSQAFSTVFKIALIAAIVVLLGIILLPTFSKTSDLDASKLAGIFPSKLNTEFISTVDWPPKAVVLKQAFGCESAGSEIARAGRTDKTVVNGHLYCVTKESGGAAGSIYTSYAYAFPVVNNQTAIVSFSLRFPQCANYPEPKMSQCEKERSSFDINGIIDNAVGKFVK